MPDREACSAFAIVARHVHSGISGAVCASKPWVLGAAVVRSGLRGRWV